MKIYISGAITHAPKKMKGIVEGLRMLLEQLGHEVTAPQLGDIGDDPFWDDVHAIEACDAVVAVLDYPSTGMGYELAVAHSLGKKIIPILVENYDDSVAGAWMCFPKRENPFVDGMIKHICDIKET